MREKTWSLATTIGRVVVAVATVYLCVMMIEHGGWWVVAFIIWFPVNFIVTAAFGDATPDKPNDNAESSTWGE